MKRRNSDNESNTTSFLDLLFNLLLGFVMMLIIVLAIVKAESSKPAVEDKNEFIITATWTPDTDNDVDLWVMGPDGQPVGFTRKEGEGLFLQRDDLGAINDFVTTINGQQVATPLNQEIVNIRKIIPGRYVVNLHFYRSRDAKVPKETVEVKLIKINPFSEVATSTIVDLEQGAEVTALVFEVDESGKVTIQPTTSIQFAVVSNSTSAGGFHP